MKGLQDYIEAHGCHFTTKLALSVTQGKWGRERVTKMTQKKVYYNITESTFGDIVFLVNKYYSDGSRVCLSHCVNKALDIVSNFDYYGGKVFLDWVLECIKNKVDVNLQKYI